VRKWKLGTSLELARKKENQTLNSKIYYKDDLGQTKFQQST
jgi:hypothetical protein